MRTSEDIRNAFVRLVDSCDELPLAHAALLVAAEERPELDIDAYLARFAGFASALRQRIGDEVDPYLLVGHLNRYLFGELGFRGNEEHYYDPRNSFLDQVLDRRLGVPVSLGIVYLEVGRRLGLPVRGLPVPGHFLVAYQAADEQLAIDCFHGGAVILPGKMQPFLDRMFEGRVRVRREFLEPIGARAVLTRLLGNLKRLYVRRADLRRALSISDRLVVIDPGAPGEYRDRGLLHFHLREFSAAVPDLERYLELQPDAPDAERVRSVVLESRRRRQTV